MKNFLIFAVFVFAAFVFVNNFTVPSAKFELPSAAAAAPSSAAAPLKYAALVAQTPDARIAVPIRGIKTKQIADTFGAARGADRTHQGQDIFAKKGTPVYSATTGYVWQVGENRLGGNVVMILGAGGRVYYYAHLDRHADNLRAGDQVSTDTVLGYVGSSGNAKGTPPHLHFGVYAASGALNPLELF